MTDTEMARLARQLAEALNQFAYERSAETKTHVAELHTALCAAYRAERLEPKNADQDLTN
jgi:hypothetical protein